MSQNIAEPKCPDCKVQGLKYIVSSNSVEESKRGDTWFNIAHCSQCGHVYGVFAKIINAPSMPPLPKLSSF
ncbi:MULTISPECIES: hypothetical protein [unclassified Acinetobacter]|uniref:hypothetical protein n=1 Tax=unclassified Acinetobacter TaxID=196816 RepID=UPI0029346CD2|nr:MULTISPECIES: hypothetical protein [unclassified Acinetobacter]WOE32147.1 hypothetical protein QSG84_02735 [Acinetobacter sp. SAAs470]WOE37617.1 hypothetical protein QSG86_11780 [Acinetobacter sp. SAAs474]